MIMKQIKNFCVGFCTLLFASCQKDAKLIEKAKDLSSFEAKKSSVNELLNENSVGTVYTLNNQVSGNKVMVFNRTVDGLLSFSGSYATGGNGSGGGLGNQGAIHLGDDNILLAVNAGSNSISSLVITSTGLNWKSTVASGGMRPVSITRYNHLVFVLNAGGDGNISGFTLNDDGTLTAITNSVKPLSASGVGPAQISFINEGNILVVTEKATNKIITYTVNENGVPEVFHSLISANPTPFGFAVGKNANIFVSEAVGGAVGASTLSNYHIGYDGVITLSDGPVGAGQSAACWVVLTKTGKYAYTTNTASNNISTFGITASSGKISVNNSISGTTQAGPIDAALSNNSKYLYVLNSGGHSISSFEVGNDGSLTSIQIMQGLPVGATGLAVK
jgi:6-phosphogluconolactonase